MITLMQVRKSEDDTAVLDLLNQRLNEQFISLEYLTHVQKQLVIQFMRNCSVNSYGCPLSVAKIVQVFETDMEELILDLENGTELKLFGRKTPEVLNDVSLLISSLNFRSREQPGEVGFFGSLEMIESLTQGLQGHIENKVDFNVSEYSLNDIADLFQVLSMENIQEFSSVLGKMEGILRKNMDILTNKQILILANYGCLDSEIESEVLKKVEYLAKGALKRQKKSPTEANLSQFLSKNMMLQALKPKVQSAKLFNNSSEDYIPSTKMLKYLQISQNRTQPSYKKEGFQSSKLSRSEEKFIQILDQLNIQYTQNQLFHNLYQLDFVVDHLKEGEISQIAIEINGQYHLNLNGVYHNNDKRSLISSYSLEENESHGTRLVQTFPTPETDLILNLKTRRKYEYLIKCGVNVISIDTKLFFQREDDQMIVELTKFLQN